MIFETHAHYDDDQFDEDRVELLNSLYENGIEKVVNIGVDVDNSKRIIELATEYDFMYVAVGVHPNEGGKLTDSDIEELKTLTSNDKVVAIGEIGLDYYYPEPPKDIQKRWFEAQIELAKDVHLPMVIHSREAAKDTVDIMKATHAKEAGGVVHCYSYTKEFAREFLDMDFYFGVGGVVTFKNAKKLKEAVEYIPMDKILLETDSPYLAPDPYRGKRNSSLYIPYIAQAIADIKHISVEEVIDITCENAKKMYKVI